MVCKNCQEDSKLVQGSEYCEKCYVKLIPRSEIKRCIFCGKETKIVAKGLCRACYQRKCKHGTPIYVKVKKICSVDGCNGIAVTKGLCGKHRLRWERHGHLEQTRPKGWGLKDKHPLCNIWNWRRRKGIIKPSDEWNDFWKFVDDVGERPSINHTIKKIDQSLPLNKHNFEWVGIKIKKENSESVKEYRKRYSAEWRKSHPRETKNSNLKKMFKITLDDYDDILEKQNYECAICGTKEDSYKKGGEVVKMNLAVDHNHKTGKIRGLLCRKCNNGIGHFKDSIELLEKAIKYLKQF